MKIDGNQRRATVSGRPTPVCARSEIAGDPLLHSTWWTIDQHSAVLVVSLAAVSSSALAFLAASTGNRPWWIFVGCGIVAGDFQATFYLATASESVYLPLTEMYVDGTVSGVVAGAVLTLLLRGRKRSAG